MIYVYEGVVKDHTIVLDQNVHLPEGARVEVRVQLVGPRGTEAGDKQEDLFEAVLRRRAAYAGRRIGIDEIIEEEKQDREERFDHWLFPDSRG
jgi:hypothetical protein